MSDLHPEPELTWQDTQGAHYFPPEYLTGKTVVGACLCTVDGETSFAQLHGDGTVLIVTTDDKPGDVMLWDVTDLPAGKRIAAELMAVPPSASTDRGGADA